MKRELAIQQGVSQYEKSVKPASQAKRLLQPSNMNNKLGKGVVTVKKWKGMPMYSLSLEERATCPKDCQQWNTCYGNHMPFATRIQIDDTFYDKLESELRSLNEKHSQGFIVRLHVLGDFPNKEYVKFWGDMVEKYKTLHIFGYTHQKDPYNNMIAFRIDHYNHNPLTQHRFRIRFSDTFDTTFRANVETKENATGIICPEQTGKTKSCLTCGLCWAIDKPISFLPH